MDSKKARTARAALQKYLNKHYTKAEQEEIGYCVDIEKNDVYIWPIEVKGKRMDLIYTFETKTVEVKELAIA